MLAAAFLTLSSAPAFAFGHFWAVSESMQPTILPGDHFLALPYGASGPERGDIVTFRIGRESWIKRIVGMPGEAVQITAGRLLIEGQDVERVPVRKDVVPGLLGEPVEIAVFREINPDGRSYLIHEQSDSALFDFTTPVAVPDGHYFVMGDNRDNSVDSRADMVGFVSRDAIVGKVATIHLSLDNGVQFWEMWRWPGNLRSERMFTSVYQ